MFRLISCCTILYKIISKILAHRLMPNMELLVDMSQSGFILGRHLSVNVLLSTELINGYGRKYMTPGCKIKIEMKKAYVTIEWPFLRDMLQGLGFPFRFVEWIMHCITTINYSISFNGSSITSFKAGKELRQGDLLSSFLFALCLEYLSRSFKALYCNRGFRFHPRCKRSKITHLAFANDLLLFSYGDLNSISVMWVIFTNFSSVSGLHPNPEKCAIYFSGVSREEEDEIMKYLRVPRGEFPFKYLDIPLSTKKLSLSQCKQLVDRITTRLNSWTNKLLSY